MFDVVIVGAGPVGLFLACELKLAGVDPVIIERLPAPSQADKAHGIGGQVVRLLDDRGLYERLGGSGVPKPVPAFFFGTLPLPVHVLGDDNPIYMLPINQRDIERILAERAAELGVDLRRGHQVLSFTQSDDHVDLVVATPGGAQEHLGARFVVGCDGGHSEIRKRSGIPFPGIVDDRAVMRSALIAPTEQIRQVPGGRVAIEGSGEIPGNFHRTERGIFMAAFFDPEHPFITTLEWEDHPAGSYPGPGAPVTMKEMEESVERVLGVRMTLSPPPEGSPTLLRRICGRNTRLADRYRDRRAFIAGDAAHVHAASGGPGLNLGLQDAANLAWKLAAELHGWAPEGLLDTYETERRALGARVFMQTQAQTALMAPGGNVTALRELFTELMTKRENVRMIAELMAGSDVRYDMGEAEPADATGRFAPSIDLKTGDGRVLRLAELRRDARPLLVDLSDGPALAEAVSPWSDRVARVAAQAATPSATSPASSLLIRPDGYVAWSGTDPDGLRAALGRWFGAAKQPAESAAATSGN
jgi:2-polyprenyl-6-methoxyphenol hydroxylase-like FAD-dependent oxidoreductase